MSNYTKLASNFHIVTNSLPDRYKVEFNLQFSSGGSFFEKPGQKGVSHLLEHCILGRTADLDFYKLKDYLFEKNIYLNAATGVLGMYITVSGHRNDFGTMLDLILKFGLAPTLSQDVLDREREIVLREISERRGDPAYRLYYKSLKHVFEEESRYLNEVLGLPEDVANATLETFQDLHSGMLSRSHIILSVSGGGIDEKLITEKAHGYLPQLSGQNTLEINFQPKNVLRNFKYEPVVSNLAHEHAELTVYIPCPVNLENRTTRYFIQSLFIRHPEGILYNRLRNELGMIYGLNCTFDQSTQTLNLELSCEIRYIEKIVEEIKILFSDFSKVFNESKAKILREITIKRQQMSQDEPQAVVDFLVENLTDYGKPVTFNDYVQDLAKVESRDIEALYQSIQNSLDKLQIVVVSNKKEVEELFKV